MASGNGKDSFDEVTPSHGPPIPIDAPKPVAALPSFEEHPRSLRPSILAPGQKRARRFLMTSAVLLILVGLLVIFGPIIARRLLVEALRKNGVNARIGQVELHWKLLVLRDTNFSSTRITWASLAAKRIDVRLDDSFALAEVQLDQPEVAIDGRFGDIRREWQTTTRGAWSSALPRKIGIENGLVKWTNVLGDETLATLGESTGSFELPRTEEGSLEGHLRIKDVRFAVNGRAFGPWRGDVTMVPTKTVTRIHFDESQISHLTWSDEQGRIVVDSLVTRTSPKAFGLPPGFIGTNDEEARLEGRAHLEVPVNNVGTGNAQIELSNLLLSGLSSKIDARAAWDWTRGQTPSFKTTGVFSVAGFRGIIDGKNELHDDVFRAQLNLMAGPKPCDRALRDPGASIAQLNVERANLERSTKTRSASGTTGLVGAISFDAREAHLAEAVLGLTGKCKNFDGSVFTAQKTEAATP